MSDTTVCVPVNPDGTIHQLLGQAHTVATCRIHDGVVTDWAEHVVDWDTTYGVDVLGVHHPGIIRFVQQHQVTAVVANDVCESMQGVLRSMGLDVLVGNTGNARSAVTAVAVAA